MYANGSISIATNSFTINLTPTSLKTEEAFSILGIKQMIRNGCKKPCMKANVTFFGVHY